MADETRPGGTAEASYEAFAQLGDLLITLT